MREIVYSPTALDCKAVTCCLASDPSLGDFSGFSFVGGDFPGGSIYGNPESTFIVECPEGVVCDEGVYPYPITIPENTVQCPYCESPPGEPIYLSVPCNGDIIEKTLPPETSEIEINRTIFDMMRECGQSLANKTRPTNTATIANFANAAIDPVQCSAEEPVFATNPGGLLTYDSATKLATLPAGTHTSSVSQADADAAAAAYVTAQIAKYVAEGGVCIPDGCIEEAETMVWTEFGTGFNYVCGSGITTCSGVSSFSPTVGRSVSGIVSCTKAGVTSCAASQVYIEGIFNISRGAGEPTPPNCVQTLRGNIANGGQIRIRWARGTAFELYTTPGPIEIKKPLILSDLIPPASQQIIVLVNAISGAPAIGETKTTDFTYTIGAT